MRITVISLKDIAPSTGISHDFDSRGGTIGREPENDLVLPDPERHISRMQARVLFENDSFLIEDHGGNATLVNGNPIGRGNRALIRDGDTLTIGAYTLRAETSRMPAGFPEPARARTPPPANDPLGLFGASSSSDPFGLAPPSPRAPEPPSPSLEAPVAPRPAPAANSDDPFAVFMTAPATAPATVSPQSPVIPADPFARPAAVPAPRQVLDLDLNLAPSASVDTLFGLQGSANPSDPFSGTPLSSHPPAERQAPANETSDPLALFGGARAAPAPAPVRDDASLLSEGFEPPRPLTPEAPATAPGIVVSWSDRPAPATAQGQAAASPQRITPPVQPATELHRPVPPASTAIPPAVESAPAASAPMPADLRPAPRRTEDNRPGSVQAAAAGSDELIAAFQRGLGFPLQLQDGLSPERMEQVGRILREAVEGTMALLTARALTKREIRAEVTMILSKQNNPLKFSPDVQFALIQLLAPQGRGFMEPVAAMRDAYDDLRSHQFGFMAGMRAALTGVLERFRPQELESRISSRGFLDSVLPGGRKARLWDLYEQHFADISHEAEDDFQTLFGRAFLKAYEEQIDRLQSEPGRAP